jgi:hypothetical protein
VFCDLTLGECNSSAIQDSEYVDQIILWCFLAGQFDQLGPAGGQRDDLSFVDVQASDP